jgi:hypothetical protein
MLSYLKGDRVKRADRNDDGDDLLPSSASLGAIPMELKQPVEVYDMPAHRLPTGIDIPTSASCKSKVNIIITPHT